MDATSGIVHFRFFIFHFSFNSGRVAAMKVHRRGLRDRGRRGGGDENAGASCVPPAVLAVVAAAAVAAADGFPHHSEAGVDWLVGVRPAGDFRRGGRLVLHASENRGPWTDADLRVAPEVVHVVPDRGPVALLVSLPVGAHPGVAGRASVPQRAPLLPHLSWLESDRTRNTGTASSLRDRCACNSSRQRFWAAA